jgi:hypothetical protein
MKPAAAGVAFYYKGYSMMKQHSFSSAFLMIVYALKECNASTALSSDANTRLVTLQ